MTSSLLSIHDGEPIMSSVTSSSVLAEAPIGESYDPLPEWQRLAIERQDYENDLTAIKDDLSLLFPQLGSGLARVVVRDREWEGSAEQNLGRGTVTIQSIGHLNSLGRDVFTIQELDDKVSLTVNQADFSHSDQEAAATARYTTDALVSRLQVVSNFFDKHQSIISPDAVMLGVGKRSFGLPMSNQVSFVSVNGEHIIFSSPGGPSVLDDSHIPQDYKVAVEARDAEGRTGKVIYTYQYDHETHTLSLQPPELTFAEGLEIIDQVAGRILRSGR